MSDYTQEQVVKNVREVLQQAITIADEDGLDTVRYTRLLEILEPVIEEVESWE